MRSLSKLGGLIAVALALLGSAWSAGPANAAYPEHPITIIVPWGAGGGTDATGRIIASLMATELGVPVSVVNRTGGAGVIGHSAIAEAAPDGYTLGVVTVEIGMMHWQGLTDLTYRDYTPLALYNADPAGLQVRADSEWHKAQDMLDAIKASPGKYKASGTGQGGIWHLALAGMLQAAGVAPEAAPWVPSQGSAPAMQDLVAGGVDIVTCSVPEAQALLEAGRAKSLAVMGDQRNAAFPDIPTLKEATGLDWKVAAWRGIAGPKGLPGEVTQKLVPVLEKIWNRKEFKDFMAQRGFGLVWQGPDGFEQWMAESDQSLGKVMKAVRIAK
jgi:tripartite-type tricarboxylate transporter receptor subunit TctC